MKYLQAVVILLLALALTGFIQQNGSLTTLTYWKWVSPQLPISLFIIAAFAAGYIMAVLFGIAGSLRSRLRLSQAERQVRALRQEKEALEAARGAQAGEGGGSRTTRLLKGAQAGPQEGPAPSGGNQPQANAGPGGAGGATDP